MKVQTLASVVALLLLVDSARVSDAKKKHHHHKHHHGKATQNKSAHKEAAQAALNVTFPNPGHSGTVVADTSQSYETSENAIVAKMKKLEDSLAKREPSFRGKLQVNGPLPADFSDRFVQAAAAAAGCSATELKVVETEALDEKASLAEILFEGPKDIVSSLEAQAADSNSKLTNGPLRSFLIAKDSADGAASGLSLHERAEASLLATSASKSSSPGDNDDPVDQTGSKVDQTGIDIDTAMPYGELEPFGREDTAQELTESSVKESDQMVDQLERAEVAEEKRAVFRALTRLRGAAITSFDGVARSQTGNIDEYNKVHQWRNTHPLHHLADEESDISKWAFPDNADF